MLLFWSQTLAMNKIRKNNELSYSLSFPLTLSRVAALKYSAVTTETRKYDKKVYLFVFPPNSTDFCLF